MRWNGPSLDEEQIEVLSLMDDLLASGEPVEDDAPEDVEGLRSQLAELGLWTLGVPEEYGGSGAPLATTLMVLERLGRLWPAVAWASVQAQAAIHVLGRDSRFTDLVRDINAAEGIAVVDARGEHVHLTVDQDHVYGTIHRLDAATPEPRILVLEVDGTVRLIDSEGVSFAPVRRTGLGGAMSAAASVDGLAVEISDADLDAARTLMNLGGAAIAAGIAGAAAEAAFGYASDRVQFNAPLTALPTVRQSLQLQSQKATVSLRSIFGGDARDVAGSAAVLASATEAALDVSTRALQSHGGYGYLIEYPAERFVRDAVSLRAASGALAAQRHSWSDSTEWSPQTQEGVARS